KKENIDEKNPALHYPQIYDKRFEIDTKEGFSCLEKIIKGKEPSCGYSVLVQILANARHNVAITTNFDSMIEDAMFTYTQEKPLVCGHESLTVFITPMITRPLIAKIHRDLLYAPKNSTSETSNLPENWEKALTNILNIYTPLVIGYGGNDGSLMGFLGAIEKIEGGIFWFYRENNGEPDKKIKELVAKHNGYLVPIEGFDEMMIQMNNELGYGLLDGKIIEVAKQRAQRYKEQIENIQKKDSETTKALKETISKRKRDWWSVELEASAEQDIEKRDKIYINGIKEFQKSHELLGNYALFLKNIRKDYDRAEEYYKRALELDPNDADYTGNYALFLHNIRKDYDRAEEYYKRALE
ncbi:MAG: tetratricopeptide repeat protein, partial [Candidatus Desantisbacteria bacterium]